MNIPRIFIEDIWCSVVMPTRHQGAEELISSVTVSSSSLNFAWPVSKQHRSVSPKTESTPTRLNEEPQLLWGIQEAFQHFCSICVGWQITFCEKKNCTILILYNWSLKYVSLHFNSEFSLTSLACAVAVHGLDICNTSYYNHYFDLQIGFFFFFSSQFCVIQHKNTH